MACFGLFQLVQLVSSLSSLSHLSHLITMPLTPLTPLTPPLSTYSQLPAWQKDNQYILSGYVPAFPSYRHCFNSLFYLHNESVNIYSHLIPSISSLFFLSAPFPIALFALGSMTCLGLSATFHTLKSHSHPVASFGNHLDYLGIVLLIHTSTISVLIYLFQNNPSFRWFFSLLTSCFALICSYLALNPTFRAPHWRSIRAAVFVSFGLSGILPIISLGFLNGWHFLWLNHLNLLLIEAVLYILGAFIYALRVPERWAPGRFDFWCHSHQIFHFLVVAAAVVHGVALYKLEYV